MKYLLALGAAFLISTAMATGPISTKNGVSKTGAIKVQSPGVSKGHKITPGSQRHPGPCAHGAKCGSPTPGAGSSKTKDAKLTGGAPSNGAPVTGGSASNPGSTDGGHKGVPPCAAPSCGATPKP
ncbi:MAG: hypothetical protein ACHQ2Z_05725 [Elusimicrobiota bacterium]